MTLGDLEARASLYQDFITLIFIVVAECLSHFNFKRLTKLGTAKIEVGKLIYLLSTTWVILVSLKRKLDQDFINI